jgi:hypothetical protein
LQEVIVHRTSHHLARVAVLGLIALVATARAALAGPPLVCHPFNIGTAQSLAWTASGNNWRGDVAGYDVTRLADETTALLTPTTPIVVRMETLRRAAIYALRDEKVADRLLTKLVDRTHKSEGGAKADALAWFDAGYFVETLKQAAPVAREKNPELATAIAGMADKVDGYAMVQKSLTLRGSEPSIEFAAAIITLSRDRADHAAHAAKARDGAKQDALLAQNIDMLGVYGTK